jgi:hypothetical protein
VRTTHLIAAAVVVLSAAGLIGFNWWRTQTANISVAKAWNVEGPPCPTLTAVEFEAGRYTAAKSFDYDGILIARHSGHVSCSDVKQGGGKSLFVDRVCQFTSPAVITVTSAKGAYYFAPGAGHGATVAIHDGVPRCVLGSTFTLQDG